MLQYRKKLIKGYFSYRYLDVMPESFEEWLWVADLLHCNLKSTFRQLPVGSLILDAGCGVGYLEYYLMKHRYNFTIHALDLSKEQIKMAEKILSENFPNFRQHITFITADLINYLKSPSNPIYNCITLIDVLEHFPKENIIGLLNRIYCKLNANGTLIIRVPNMDNPLNIPSFYQDFTHETAFTRKSLNQCLRSAGFIDIDIFYETRPLHPKDKKSLLGRLKLPLRAIRKRLLKFLLSVPHHQVMAVNLIAIAHKPREK